MGNLKVDSVSGKGRGTWRGLIEIKAFKRRLSENLLL